MSTPQQAISTYLDIVKLFPQLYDTDVQKWMKSPTVIRATIMDTDNTLRTQLRKYAPADMTTTPRVMIPIGGPNNEGEGTLLIVNPTTANLLTISEATAVYSQVYKITFTSATEFIVESDLSGAQGTGATDSDFTTTDTYLTISKELWNGKFVKSDIFYVRVYNHEGMLVTLSAYLAAIELLDGIFTEEVPDASPTSSRYQRNYDRLIKAIQDGRIFLEIDLIARDINPVQVDYEIDQYGQDITNYEELGWNKTSQEVS